MTTGPNLQLTSLIATRQVLPATRRVEPTRPTTQTATPRLSFIAHRPRSGQITPRHKKPHRETAGFLKFKWGVKVATDHVGMPSAKKKAPPTPGMLLKKNDKLRVGKLELNPPFADVGQLRLRRRIRASPPRPSSAVEDGSGMAVRVKVISPVKPSPGAPSNKL